MSPQASNARVRSAPPRPVAPLHEIRRVAEGGRERIGYIPLDRNERLAPLPAWVLEEIRAGVDSDLLTSYPMLDDVYDELAGTFGLPRAQVLLTAGSDAAFRALYQSYVRPGDHVAMLAPSYAMYPIYARMFGAEPIEVQFGSDLTLDPDALLCAVAAGVRMVVLANPNQPTSTRLADDVLAAVIERAREFEVLVVIDEAYFPFSRSSILSWVANESHLVVTRTFSKAWGIAGLRIGLVAAHPEVIANLYKVRSAYDVNSFAALCTRVLLAHPEVANDYVARVDAGRKLVCDRARRLGLKPIPGDTNFQLIRVAEVIDPALLVERLRDHKYLIKGPFAAPCLRDCVRVTLGPPELMAEFCDVLELVVSGG